MGNLELYFQYYENISILEVHFQFVVDEFCKILDKRDRLEIAHGSRRGLRIVLLRWSKLGFRARGTILCLT